jgi:integrase
MRKPYYKATHECWYANIDGKHVRLHKDKDEAEKKFHRLMADKAPVTSHTTVYDLLDRFLSWVQDNQAPRTYEWYFFHLQRFGDFIGKKLRLDEVMPGHPGAVSLAGKVDAWLKRDYKDASPSGKNGAVRALSRSFNWAKQRHLISINPLAGSERPAAEAREVYVNPEQVAAAIAKIKVDDPFLDIVTFIRETGCRPEEARIVQAKHWSQNMLVLERKNSKKKKARRVIRLNDAAMAIVRKLALAHPDGPLFLNRRRRPWTASALGQAFGKVKVDFPFFPYALRHAWCTDALMRGVDPITVSVLLGHKDAKMVMQVYSHLCQQHDFLNKKLEQATLGSVSSVAHPS